MSGSRKTYTGLLIAAIFILLEVAAIGMLRKSSTLQNIWINRFSHRVMAIAWGGGERIRNYFSLEEQNRQLAEENFLLFKENQRYLSMKNEFEAMRKLDSSGFNTHFNYIAATITKISRNSQHNYIILDKGSEEGVQPNSSIVTNRGVVGIISAVDKHYSYGITLMNDKVTVSTRIGNSGVVAPLSWDGIHTNGAILRNIPLHLDIQPGDTVRTSGFSMIYPPDIPIGVTGESRLVDGANNVIDVQLFEDFGALKHVIIASTPVREKLQEYEKL